MAGDLGTGDWEVYVAEMERRTPIVLNFWFSLEHERHFAKDPKLDKEIAERFGKWVDDARATDATGFWSDADGTLAAIILIDQFSRNIYRGTAAAFTEDHLAQWLSLHAIGRRWDRTYPAERRAFVYMPLMHAEDAPLQALSVAKFVELGEAENLAYAREHAAVIERYGRFPSRNAALGRASTPAEKEYLSRPDAGW